MRNSAKFRENFNLQQFKVIQGHRHWCQSKAHILDDGNSPFLRYGDLLAENFVFFLPLSFGAPASYVAFGISRWS